MSAIPFPQPSAAGRRIVFRGPALISLHPGRATRDDLDAVGAPVALPGEGGVHRCLRELAKFSSRNGTRSAVKRQTPCRRCRPMCGNDLGSFVAGRRKKVAARQTSDRQLSKWGGQFENLSASAAVCGDPDHLRRHLWHSVFGIGRRASGVQSIRQFRWHGGRRILFASNRLPFSVSAAVGFIVPV